VIAVHESNFGVEQGQGAGEGTVRMNVYLGHSIETYVGTANGEVLIQVDDPASKKIFPEGAPVSIDFNPRRIRLLKADETPG
jgi:iron(III) transport system ATP-binding protein